MRRRFEYTGGSSYKFWEVWQDGSAHRVRFGRIGTDGQERSKDHGTAMDARAAIRKLIRQKIDKGYVEVTPTDTAFAAPTIAEEKPKPDPKRQEAARKTIRRKQAEEESEEEQERFIRPRQVRPVASARKRKGRRR